MKKGISLIVLVITIIIMIILAGAVILSLSSSDVTKKASYSTLASDRANFQAEFATIYAEYMAENYNTDPAGTEITADPAYTTWSSKVTAAGFNVDGTGAGIKVLKTYATKTLAVAAGFTVTGADAATAVVTYGDTTVDWVKVTALT